MGGKGDNKRRKHENKLLLIGKLVKFRKRLLTRGKDGMGFGVMKKTVKELRLRLLTRIRNVGMMLSKLSLMKFKRKIKKLKTMTKTSTQRRVSVGRGCR